MTALAIYGVGLLAGLIGVGVFAGLAGEDPFSDTGARLCFFAFFWPLALLAGAVILAVWLPVSLGRWFGKLVGIAL